MVSPFLPLGIKSAADKFQECSRNGARISLMLKPKHVVPQETGKKCFLCERVRFPGSGMCLVVTRFIVHEYLKLQ